MKTQKSNVANVQGTNAKNTNKNVSSSKKVEKDIKKDELKERSKDVVASSVAKKYLIDYANLSEKEQKKERSKRRRAIDSFITLHFNLSHAKDDKGLKELKANFKEFIKSNYVLSLSNVSAKDLYNAKDEKKIKDLQELINYVKG